MTGVSLEQAGRELGDRTRSAAGSVGGAAYLRALREPLPGLRAVVSGGIGVADVQGYLAAGAYAVSLGGALIDRAAGSRGDVEAVAAWARQGLAQVREVPEPC